MKQIWHIYYATKGAAGAYIDALLKASVAADVPVRGFVSAHYKYATDHVTKCFFPFTDRIDRRSSLIRIIRGSELAVSYLYLIVKLIFARPRVCIHWIDDFSITYVFFRLCKALGLHVTLTCHDVSSHYLGMNARRRGMILLADGLIVHNSQARRSLIELCGSQVERKILTYPFPTSSYDEILAKSECENAKRKLQALLGEESGYFLFLGVVRKSKGIETLLDAWSSARMTVAERLVIAGSWTDPDQETRTRAANDPRCIVINRYLSDEEYVELIRGSRFVVLPYLDCTHSAVLISCANHGGAVIVSDTGLFNESLPDYDLTFPKGDGQALARLLERTQSMDSQGVSHYRRVLADAVSAENNLLIEKLKAAFGGASDCNLRKSECEELIVSADGRSIPLRAIALLIGRQSGPDSFQVVQRAAGEIELRYDPSRMTENTLMKIRQTLSNCLGKGTIITLKSSAPFVVLADGKRHTVLSLIRSGQSTVEDSNS